METGAVKITRALLGVSDKAGLVEFARALARHGVEIVSTGGTAAALEADGVKVRGVENFTGLPEMLDGRVKTLHPKIHGGILARRADENHQREMQQHRIEPIDMVVVNFYPFEKTVAASHVRLADVGCGHGFLEWIEIHDHHVNRLDPMLLHLALMILVSAPGQDSAVNLGMQRLDPTVEHLGQAGKILDGPDFHSCLFQSCCRASGRYYFNPVPLERRGKGCETRLVRDA